MKWSIGYRAQYFKHFCHISIKNVFLGKCVDNEASVYVDVEYNYTKRLINELKFKIDENIYQTCPMMESASGEVNSPTTFFRQLIESGCVPTNRTRAGFWDRPQGPGKV